MTALTETNGVNIVTLDLNVLKCKKKLFIIIKKYMNQMKVLILIIP